MRPKPAETPGTLQVQLLIAFVRLPALAVSDVPARQENGLEAKNWLQIERNMLIMVQEQDR